jgi:NADH-quinone oxidoreductase subunit L
MLQFILLAPLAAAIIAGFGWRLFGETVAQALTTGVSVHRLCAVVGNVPDL